MGMTTDNQDTIYDIMCILGSVSVRYLYKSMLKLFKLYVSILNTKSFASLF